MLRTAETEPGVDNDRSIVMYTTPWCGFCAAARNLLNNKNVEFTELNVRGNPALREEMISRSGRNTVPQIFVGDRHIGGYDELAVLDATDELDDTLNPGTTKPPD